MTQLLLSPATTGITLSKADFRAVRARGNAAIHLARYGASWDDEPIKYAAIKRAFTMLERSAALAGIDQLCFLALNQSGSLMSWIAAGPNPANGGMTFGPLGFLGNGTSSYIDTGFNPATAPSPRYTQNSAHVGVYVSDNAGPNTSVNVAAGTMSGTTRTLIYPKSLATASAYRINAASTITINPNPSHGQNGLFLAQRFSANGCRLLFNGDVLHSDSSDRPSDTVPNANITIGRHGTVGYGSGAYAGWSIGRDFNVGTGVEAAYCEAMMILGQAMTVS